LKKGQKARRRRRKRCWKGFEGRQGVKKKGVVER
jgi:hypothetical protein